MLYLNGKYFDVNDINGENKEHVKDYRDKVAKLRENYGRWLLVKTKDKDVKNPSGLLEPKKTITVPLICTVGGRNGTEEWAYSENAASVKDGQVLLDTRQLLVRFGEYMLDMDATPDLAYFLTEKHVFFKNGKLHIHDERSLAKVEADERRLRARLESSIYNDTSHLNVNREKIGKNFRCIGTVVYADKNRQLLVYLFPENCIKLHNDGPSDGIGIYSDVEKCWFDKDSKNDRKEYIVCKLLPRPRETTPLLHRP
jgi:hypothetical protein